MIRLVMLDLTPFFMCYILFLNLFALCFIVLKCDVDEELADVKVLGQYELMLL